LREDVCLVQSLMSARKKQITFNENVVCSLEGSKLSRSSDQNDTLIELERVFGRHNVIEEWDVAKNSSDAFTRKLYCPRVDYAIGPFNIDAHIIDNNKSIIEASEKYGELVQRFKLVSDRANSILEANPNPRCFLAIELEDKTSRKHRLGSLINASAIGRIGIIVASNDEVFSSFVKIRSYLDFLLDVGKTRYAPKNVLILREGDFLEALKRDRTSHHIEGRESG